MDLKNWAKEQLKTMGTEGTAVSSGSASTQNNKTGLQGWAQQQLESMKTPELKQVTMPTVTGSANWRTQTAGVDDIATWDLDTAKKDIDARGKNVESYDAYLQAVQENMGKLEEAYKLTGNTDYANQHDELVSVYNQALKDAQSELTSYNELQGIYENAYKKQNPEYETNLQRAQALNNIGTWDADEKFNLTADTGKIIELRNAIANVPEEKRTDAQQNAYNVYGEILAYSMPDTEEQYDAVLQAAAEEKKRLESVGNVKESYLDIMDDFREKKIYDNQEDIDKLDDWVRQLNENRKIITSDAYKEQKENEENAKAEWTEEGKTFAGEYAKWKQATGAEKEELQQSLVDHIATAGKDERAAFEEELRNAYSGEGGAKEQSGLDDELKTWYKEIKAQVARVVGVSRETDDRLFTEADQAWEDLANAKKEYSTLQKQLQTIGASSGESGLEHAGNIANKALSTVSGAPAGLIKMMYDFGSRLTGSEYEMGSADWDALGKLAAGCLVNREAATQALQTSEVGMSQAGQIASELSVSLLAALPNALMAIASGGASMTAEGLTAYAAAQQLTGAKAMLNTVSSTMQSMVENPMYWSSFVTATGDGYLDAIEKGADQDTAMVYATVNGILNAYVEIGGGIETFVKEAEGKAVKDVLLQLVESSIDEGGEEIRQGIIERGLQNIILGADNKSFSVTDREAIVSVYGMLDEFMGGFIVGGVLGGVESIGQITSDVQAMKVARQLNEQAMSIPEQYRPAQMNVSEATPDSVVSYYAELVAAEAQWHQSVNGSAKQAIAEKAEGGEADTNFNKQARMIMSDKALLQQFEEENGKLPATNSEKRKEIARILQEKAGVTLATQETAKTTQEATKADTAAKDTNVPTKENATDTNVGGNKLTQEPDAEGRYAYKDLNGNTDMYANDADTMQHTIDMLEEYGNDTARYGGTQFEVVEKIDGTFTARAVVNGEVYVQQDGFKNRMEAVQWLQSERKADRLPINEGEVRAPEQTEVKTEERVKGLKETDTLKQLRDEKKITKKTMRQLQWLGEKLGVEIELMTEEQIRAEGKIDPKESIGNAFYEDGRIVISTNADDPVTMAAVHEAVHRIKETDGAAFKELAGAVWRGLSGSKMFAEAFKGTADMYNLMDANGNIKEGADPVILEEMVAQGAAMIAQDTNLLNQMVKEDRNAVQRLLDAITDILDKLWGYKDTGEISVEDRTWYNDLYNNLDKIRLGLMDALDGNGGIMSDKEAEDSYEKAEKNASEIAANIESGEAAEAVDQYKFRKWSQKHEITAESTDEERTAILSEKAIKPASVNDSRISKISDLMSNIPQNMSGYLHGEQLRSIKKTMLNIAKRLNLNAIVLKNSQIDFDFGISNTNVGVSTKHQMEYKGTFEDFAKMLTCVDELVENAEMIEKHAEKKTDTTKENKNLAEVSVMLSVMKEGKKINPVELVIKEFTTNPGGLYMTVIMDNIEESEVITSPVPQESGSVDQPLSDSKINVADLIAKINPENSRFFKYVPDGMLTTEEQRAAKQRALQGQAKEYDSFRVTGDGTVKWSRKHTTDTDYFEVTDVVETPVADALENSNYGIVRDGVTASVQQGRDGVWYGALMGLGAGKTVAADSREEAIAMLEEKAKGNMERQSEQDEVEVSRLFDVPEGALENDALEFAKLPYQEAIEYAAEKDFPIIHDADGNETRATPGWTWVKANERGNYGMVTGKSGDSLIVTFINKGNGNTKSVTLMPNEVLWVQGEYSGEQAPGIETMEAPPEVEQFYDELSTSEYSAWKNQSENPTAPKTQEEIVDTLFSKGRDSFDPRLEMPEDEMEGFGMVQKGESINAQKDFDPEEADRTDKAWRERISEQQQKSPTKEDFTGTENMAAVGVTGNNAIAGSVVNYKNVNQVQSIVDAVKKAKSLIASVIKKAGLSEAEKSMARMVANGEVGETEIPKSMRVEAVRQLAEMYRATEGIDDDTLQRQRDKINRVNYLQAVSTFADSENYTPGKFGNLGKAIMNERTPLRVMKSIFGADKGTSIFNQYFRPVYENNGSMIRWVNEQKSKIQKFRDTKGNLRELTDTEKAMTQQLMEGMGFAKRAEKLQGYDKNSFDAAVANFHHLMELQKAPGGANAYEAAQKVLQGEMAMDEAMVNYGVEAKQMNEMLKAVETKLQEDLDKDLKEIVDGYELYEQVKEQIDNDAEADANIINRAAVTYQQLYNDYYKAINEFMVAHGYEPIGFIEGYAPRMQKAETQNMLQAALSSFGIQLGDVGELPAGIAGRTADFKPNMKYNPHFQHRVSKTGGDVEYNVVKGFESYVSYLGQVFYHTDDVMRFRQAVNYFRTAYGSPEIAANLEAANSIRYASDEQKLSFVQGMPGYVPGMTKAQINDLIDSYTETQYANAKTMSRYSELTTWLENYANILAGKQSMADRGVEYSGGRAALQIGQKLMAAFQKANVAGSFSSVLNQLSQVPQITTKLGTDYSMRALKDIASGALKAEGFTDRSDFLTGKQGINYIEQTSLDKIVSTMFAPAGVVDELVSSLAVRGEYLRQLDMGVNEETAMRRADDYGRQVMGSRVKGESPQAYASKGFFNQMLHVYQVEATNTFDYIVSDLPQEIRKLAQKEGKSAAATKTAAIIVAYLVRAFALNRLIESISGGSPAVGDLFGMTAQFFASGEGITSSTLMKTLIDDGIEYMTGERIFDTSRDNWNDSFDLDAAMGDLGYTVMNDLPLVQNAAGILGLGDKTLPTVGFNKAAKGVSQIYNGIKDAAVKGDAGYLREAAEGAASIAAQMVPGGRQLNKTFQGLETMAMGGTYAGYGEDAVLQYPVRDTAANWVQAAMFGRSALDESETYYASEAKRLTKDQTKLYETLTDDYGLDRQDAYDAIQQIRKIKSNKDITSVERGEQARAVINGLDLTDKEKLEMWLGLEDPGNVENKKYTGMKELMSAGASFADCVAAYDKYAELNAEEEMKASEKATEYAAWVDRYTSDSGLGTKAADGMKETFKFYQTMAVEASRYEKLNDAGLSISQSEMITNSWGQLQPEKGKETVSDQQKIWALTGMNLSNADAYTAASTLMDTSKTTTESGALNSYGKLLAFQKAGFSYEDYAAAREGDYVDEVLRYGNAGAGRDASVTMASAIAKLEPEAGKESVSTEQKVDAIAGCDVSEHNKLCAMSEVLPETSYQKLDMAGEYGVTVDVYAQFLKILPQYDSDKNGSYKYAEVQAAVQSMKLDADTSAALWQLKTGGKTNPFDRTVGKDFQSEYDAWYKDYKAKKQ